MVFHKLPLSFRMEVRKYLDYMIDYKKLYKLDDEEVFEMLSENLRLELIVHLNGRMLHNTAIFKHFDLAFISELTFSLRKETFSYGDHIFEEKDHGTLLYFIVKGSVFLLHKKTQTFIKELQADEFFGEIAFFSNQPRKATARSKHITECLILDKTDFIQNSLQYPKINEAYNNIKKEIEEKYDVTQLGIQCYLCEKQGHISPNCDRFALIRGNLKIHAIEKLQQLQNMFKREQKKKLKRTSKMNLISPEQQKVDSIATDQEYSDHVANVEQIIEVTEENDESKSSLGSESFNSSKEEDKNELEVDIKDILQKQHHHDSRAHYRKALRHYQQRNYSLDKKDKNHVQIDGSRYYSPQSSIKKKRQSRQTVSMLPQHLLSLNSMKKKYKSQNIFHEQAQPQFQRSKHTMKSDHPDQNNFYSDQATGNYSIPNQEIPLTQKVSNNSHIPSTFQRAHQKVQFDYVSKKTKVEEIHKMLTKNHSIKEDKNVMSKFKQISTHDQIKNQPTLKLIKKSNRFSEPAMVQQFKLRRNNINSGLFADLAQNNDQIDDIKISKGPQKTHTKIEGSTNNQKRKSVFAKGQFIPEDFNLKILQDIIGGSDDSYMSSSSSSSYYQEEDNL